MREEGDAFQAEATRKGAGAGRGPRGNDEPEEEQKPRAGVREESPARAAQEGVRPEQGLFTTGQEFPMVLSPGYTGQVVRRRVLSS